MKLDIFWPLAQLLEVLRRWLPALVFGTLTDGSIVCSDIHATGFSAP